MYKWSGWLTKILDAKSCHMLQQVTVTIAPFIEIKSILCLWLYHVGYAPLLVRLVQSLGRSTGWTSIQDSMRLLPGPLLEVTQQIQPEELTEALTRVTTESHPINQTLNYGLTNEDNRESSKRVLFVLVIGGLTFLEIAAFRFLSKDPNFPYRIVMGTTKLITGSSLLKSLKHNVKVL